MKETTKTSVFLGLAVLLLILAVALRPHTVEIRSEETVGQALFPKFTDAFSIKGLEIVRPLPDGTTSRFRIAERDGVWTIPSHEAYPADAKDRMPGIAEALIDLTVVAIAEPQSDDAAADRILYGVIDPTSEEVSLGEGIGTRVTVTGPNDQMLVDLVLGKEVADSENKADAPPSGGDEPAKLRYVRIPGEQTVYIVDLDAERFSTRFEDWIEKNLLDISTLDIRSLYIDEYTVETVLRMVQNRPVPQMIPNFIGDITLDYDGNATGKEKWTLRRFMSHRGPKFDYVEDQMKPDEELNVEVLDEALAALNDLKINDVARKPVILATALKTGDGLDNATDLDMLDRGFAVVDMRDPKDELRPKTTILSKNGDFRITMRDGLRYVLRFGDAAGVGTEDDAAKTEDAETKPEADGATTAGLNRTMMITAEFDESSIPRPQPEPLEEVPAEGSSKKDDGDDGDAGENGATYTAEDVRAVEQRNAEIEKRYQRAMDAYETTVENGRKRAETLNARFAPWYYVISESVYKKIHLDRGSIFRSIDIAAGKGNGHTHDGDECDDPDCPDHQGHGDGTSRFGAETVKPEMRWPTLPLLDETSLTPSFAPDWAVSPPKVPEDTTKETVEETPENVMEEAAESELTGVPAK